MRSTPLAKPAQMADVAWRTSITTHVWNSSLYSSNCFGEKQTSTRRSWRSTLDVSVESLKSQRGEKPLRLQSACPGWQSTGSTLSPQMRKGHSPINRLAGEGLWVPLVTVPIGPFRGRWHPFWEMPALHPEGHKARSGPAVFCSTMACFPMVRLPAHSPTQAGLNGVVSIDVVAVQAESLLEPQVSLAPKPQGTMPCGFPVTRRTRPTACRMATSNPRSPVYPVAPIRTVHHKARPRGDGNS